MSNSVPGILPPGNEDLLEIVQDTSPEAVSATIEHGYSHMKNPELNLLGRKRATRNFIEQALKLSKKGTKLLVKTIIKIKHLLIYFTIIILILFLI